tara:strand:+ start:1129 stop:1752 length:624 start_codon:yes stop_codon:yes gene_type:complete
MWWYQTKKFKINFEITSHCQAKCPACPRIFFKNQWDLGNHMKFEDFKSVVDLNEKIAKESCCYFAGELGDPILHPDFHRILTYASSKFDIVEVSTNGGARTSDWFHNVIMKLKNVYFHFCIDGTKEDISSIYRVNVDFEKAFDNLLSASKADRNRAWWIYTKFDFNKHDRQNARKISKEKNLKLIFRFNVSNFSVDEHDKMQSLRLL